MRGPPAPSSPVAPSLRLQLVGGLAAGFIALAAVVAVGQMPAKYAFSLIGGGLLFAAMLMIRNLRLFCLYMVLLLAPLGLRQSFMEYPHLGGASAMFIEAVDPFMLLLLYFQMRERFRGYRSEYRFPRALVLWSGMIVLGVGSVIFMEVLRISAANEVARMLKLALLAALIVNEARTTAHFRHIVIAIAIGVIIQSTVAILEYVRGGQLGLTFLGEASDEDIKTLSDATFEKARLSGEIAYRASGLMGHANLLAAYLALYLPVSIALILSTVSVRLKALLALTLVTGLPALVLTLSRAGWIDYVAAFMIVLTLGATNLVSRKRYRFARVAIISVTVAVAIAMSPQILRRLYETDPSAVQFRLQWLETARAMILDNPVFGTGLNTYVFAQLPYSVEKTPEQMSDTYGIFWPAVHNSWALTWSEQGTTGFIFFVWMHFSVLAVAVGNLRIRDPVIHALNVGLMAGFVAIMIDGMASFFVRVEAPARMFWIALGLILAIGYWRRANEAARDASPPEMPEGRGTRDSDPRPAGGRWLPQRASTWN